MLEITNFREGDILNHNHGQETPQSLNVKIEGISDSGYPVKVNGQPAEMDGPRFSAHVSLTQKINTVTASVLTPYGKYSQELTLVWDKQSFLRYNYYIDDHIFLFTDLANERPARAFDHFYLKALKKFHDDYGFKVTLNSFYHNDHHEFLLKDMPDIWKQEFIDNSDWLKFSFHARSEFPDRPYLEASGEEVGRDYDLVMNEIIRFAGESSFIVPINVHWANIHPAGAAEMMRRGVNCWSTAFCARVMGGPSLTDRMKGGDMDTVEKRSMSGEDKLAPTEGLEMHYGRQEVSNYLKSRGAYYDPSIGIFFFNCGFCGNLVPLTDVEKHICGSIALYQSKGMEIFCGGSHEQYSFPYYSNYQPDHLKRLDTSLRLLSENGYKPVFYPEGLLGNTAWN